MNQSLSDAQWIAPNQPAPCPIITRHFDSSCMREGTLHITGLGFFEAYFNGQKLDDCFFQPVVSDYEPRSFEKIKYPCKDKFSHRVYYKSYPVTLREGENELVVHLGGGWYTQSERIAEGEMQYGASVKCRYVLEGEQFCVVSDGSETWQDSDIVFSNLFLGERHDPTAIKRSGPVVVLPDAEGVNWCEQIGAPDRLIRTIQPALLGERDGRKVYDAGENISGIVRVKTKEGFIGEVTLRFAEECDADGALDFASTGARYLCRSGVHQIMTDTFVADGKARVFAPKFTWHTFRYFDMVGECEQVEVLVIHADAAVTSSFSSDNEALNFLYDAFIRTQLNNMHGSIPSDCPHRERLGYTGDGQIAAPSAMLLMDSREFYRKWIYDILDCQGVNTGHVQHTAPFQGGGGGPGGWGCAIVLVPYAYWKQWGDKSLLRECFRPMQKWIAYLKAHMTDGLVTSEEEGGWCLGDWCTLEPTTLPEPFVNTFYFIKSVETVAQICEILQEEEEMEYFRQLGAASRVALVKAYYDSETGHFCKGQQGADAFAAALGLQDVGVVAAHYEKLRHFDTGFLGTDVLCELLCEHGYVDTMVTCLSSEEMGSFLYMKRHGATTLWERWDGRESHCHPMFGAAVRQLFHGILGIQRPFMGRIGTSLDPHLPKTMNWAEGSIRTPDGEISVRLERQADGVHCRRTVRQYAVLSKQNARKCKESVIHEETTEYVF